MDQTFAFDVFLSHNSQDKPEVRELVALLQACNIRVWFDEDQLIPGRNWQPLLEQGINGSRTGAVVVGRDGLGPWEDEEMQAFLRQAVRRGKPVIPILLPGAPTQPELPMFLANRTWVDLRQGFDQGGIELLIWGINGEKPGVPAARVKARTNHPRAGVDQALAPESEPDQDAIRILHRSDFHFRTDRAWDADPVLRALTRSIGKEVADGFQPDLVAITGDLAFSGRADEYRLAGQWLDKQLLPALGGKLTREQVLLVPGNHDVDRSKVRRGVRYTQDGLLKDRSQDGIAEVLDDAEERRGLLARHAGYLAFLKDWSGQKHDLPWWQRMFEIRGHRIHIAGLDSAWMACGDEDRGRMLLGRRQLNQTLVTKDAETAELRIALLHHPWDYLAEFDLRESRRGIHQHADLLLRGHLHEPEAARFVAPDPNRSCLELAAGCVYEGSDYPNAFQWIELRPAACMARVHFRLWRDGQWTIDRNQLGCPQGWAEFDLAGQAMVHAVGSPHKLTVPEGYLTWLRVRYASVELLGYDQQQGRAITLDHVYVPAVTRSARELELEQALAVWVDKQRKPAGLDGQQLCRHLAAGNVFLVLDGLDEVRVSEPRVDHTDYPRALLLSGLADALPDWERAGNRILLTSRPYGLEEAELVRLGLTRAPLEPLPEEIQVLFFKRWFYALGQAELGDRLLAHIRGREDLDPLVVPHTGARL